MINNGTVIISAVVVSYFHPGNEIANKIILQNYSQCFQIFYTCPYLVNLVDVWISGSAILNSSGDGPPGDALSTDGVTKCYRNRMKTSAWTLKTKEQFIDSSWSSMETRITKGNGLETLMEGIRSILDDNKIL